MATGSGTVKREGRGYKPRPASGCIPSQTLDDAFIFYYEIKLYGKKHVRYCF